MKILDRYILTSYLKTFISVFLILMLIFVLQTIWLYIKELAGKDLDLEVILKFLFYMTPKLIPLVLPLTILLASIMVFGNFAENYEFAAMKSTGISLQRAMSGLSVFIVILGFTTFLFSNNVIPWAEYNSYNLRKNIAKLKPAMFLAKGQFNPVGNYNIKFVEKSGERGQYLHDVIIHIKAADGRTNATTIKANNGELVGKESSNVLKLILFDGNYYNDIIPKKPAARKKKPFAKSKFEKYIINIDLTKLNNVDIDEKSYSDKYNMLNLSGLDKAIDSLSDKYQSDYASFATTLYQRTNINNLTKKIGTNSKEKAKSTSKNKKIKEKNKKIVHDSIYTTNLLDLYKTKNKSQIVNIALNSFNSTKQIIVSKENTIKISKTNFKKHIISFHEKLALGFACVILFFVGAPLGALIRKGGIGLPMVIAILLFLTYHFIGIFATNSAKTGNFNPILASWFSTLVMLPLGVYLTRRATADRGLFEVENIIEPIKKILKIKEKDKVDYKFLSSYKNEELIDVIKNYENLGHDEDTCYEAIKVLEHRGLSISELREKGLSVNHSFDTTEIIAKNYKEHTQFAITLFSIGAVLLVLFFVFRNNKLPSLASASIQLSLASLFLYIIYYIKSVFNLFNFYKHIKRKTPNLILLLLGLPIYMLTYFFLKVKMREDLRLNCLDSLK
ncbi:LptF/LptG family permease [uncultured Algibacter sp.]|uniref:LptF/LptG family permease n=1 Tax=uncultured Algibacter sp. TaxID=298659 RepID=UPI00260C57BA|nr:LptF/LptG family permease [uncultured Algibacter sp.]